MDLPLLSKKTNMYPSFAGVLMFFKSKSGGAVDSGRVRAHFPQAVKHEKYEEKYENKIIDKTFTKDELIAKLNECNVIGCGGSAYPMAPKIENVMASDEREKILLINAVECDIGLIQDEYIMANFFGEIEAAARVLRDTCAFSKVVLGTTKKYSYESDVIEIKRVGYGYPAGAEKILISNVLGIVIPRDDLPTSHGILVQNVQTMLAAYNALANDEVCTGKYITVANLTKRSGSAVYVPFGSSVQDLATKYLGEKGDLVLLTGGGSMSGHVAKDLEVTDNKTAIVAYGIEPYNQRSVDCVECHACSRACPMNIDVRKLADLIMGDHLEEAKAFSPERCIGCNSCTYVCFINRDNSRVIAEYNEKNS